MEDLREDEWELYNDGVLVYRRKKRRVADVQPQPQPPHPPPESLPDAETEEKNRRAYKKRVLLQLKDKYQKELDRWDFLSSTLRAVEDRSQQQQIEERREGGEDEDSRDVSTSGSCLEKIKLVDEILAKVEAEEAIIQDVLNLCDISNALCDAQEEELNQSFFDLPIWGSPRTLMAALCDDSNSEE